ncbi:MAG: putative RND superfamily exporter protein [Paracoccaceae bacterium]
MKKIIRLINAVSINNPIWVAAIWLPLVALAVLGLFRIDFEDGLRSMFSSDAPAFQDYATYSKTFSQSETDVAVLVSSPTPLDGQDFETLENFILDAQFIEGIGGVYSIFSLRQPRTDQRAEQRLLPTDLSDQAALETALNTVAEHTASGISLVSKDNRATVVVFTMAAEMSDMAGSSNTLQNLEELGVSAGIEGGIQFQITGLIPIREGIIIGLKWDQLKINVLGALLGALVSLILFRSFWVAAINTVSPVTALILCLGSFGWLGLSINALTNALPVLILVLASSDSIHLTFEIRRRMGRGEDLVAAVRHAVADIASPVVLTSLTTMLAFTSLFYSGSPIIRDLALAGTAGVFLAMLVVLFIHPMVFVLAGRIPAVKRALPLIETPANSHRKFWPLRFPSRKFRMVSFGGLALSVAVVAILFPIQPQYRFLENIDEKHPVVQTLLKVEQISGPINTVNIPVKLKDGISITDVRVFDDLEKLHELLAPLTNVRAVVSLNNIKALIEMPDGGFDPAVLADYLNAMPERFRSRLIGVNGDDLQVFAMVFDTGSQDTRVLVEAIEKALSETEFAVAQPGRPTGFLIMSSALTDEMIGQLTISFLIAALACPALIGCWFRRFDFGLAAIIPNILPIAFAGAVLTAIDFDIQITAALALTIAFGIALDDSIHVFNRLHLQMQQDKKPLSSSVINAAMAKVSPILVVTTIILSAGLIATVVSEMPMVRFFGLLCIGTFVLALLSDIVLLPAIIAWFVKDRGKA